MKYYTKISLKNIQAKFASHLQSLVHIDGGATEETHILYITKNRTNMFMCHLEFCFHHSIGMKEPKFQFAHFIKKPAL
jgi:hypothetical protein